MCILLREGSQLSNYYFVGKFTSDSSLLVSRLEYWSSAPFGRLGVFQKTANKSQLTPLPQSGQNREIIFLFVFMKRLVYMLMSSLLCSAAQ